MRRVRRVGSVLLLIAALLLRPAAAEAEGRAAGRIAAWGVNHLGQVGPDLGAGGTKTPREIVESDEFQVIPAGTSIAAGGYHTLVVAADGRVWAWGSNQWGQLGSFAEPISRSSPGIVLGPSGAPELTHVIAVSAGWHHSVALKADGTVWTWGNNQLGQLGDGTTESRTRPEQVTGLDDGRDASDRVIAIAAGGYFTLALQADGTMWAWGNNQWGQLGDGTLTNRLSPVRVRRRARGDLLDGIKAIEAGDGFSLALQANGRVWAWGNNSFGQLGSGGTDDTNAVPVRVRDANGSSLRNVIGIAGGWSHSLALLSDGSLRAWGSNQWGQLGNGTTADVTPVPVIVHAGEGINAPLADVTAIAAGAFHSLALLSNGTVRAWGNNFGGQLGDGTTENRLTPVTAQSTGVLDVRAIAAGIEFSVDLHGSIVEPFEWGRQFDLIGSNAAVPIPTEVDVFPRAADVDAGVSHSLVLTAAGQVYSWGDNEKGQLGNGTYTDHLVAQGVPGVSSIKAISAGWAHNLALTTRGTVLAWGDNHSGQLGDGSTDPSPLPLLVQDAPDESRSARPPKRELRDVIAVAGGWGHTLALKADGSVWAWGANEKGQLGDGTIQNRSHPVRVKAPRHGRRTSELSPAFLNGIVAIAAGSGFSMALRVDGTVWTWGENDVGQLGDGTFTERHFPTASLSDNPASSGVLRGVKAIAAGSSHALALKSSGVVRSWGGNFAGGLGWGGTVAQPRPGTVNGLGGQGMLSLVEAIAAGAGHSLALQSDGTAWGWGLNSSGQVGDGTEDNRPAPVQVLLRQGLVPFLHPTVIGAGHEQSLAISWAVRGAPVGGARQP